MKFNTFANTIETIVASKLPDVHVSIQPVLKANVKRTALVILNESSHVAPTLYLDEFYEDYNAGLLTADDIAHEICDRYVASIGSFKINLNNCFSYENICDKICYKVISDETNQDYLKTLPHRKIGDTDLTIIYYVPLDDEFGGTAFTQVTNSMMNMYGVTESDLFERASANTKRMYPLKFGGLLSFLTGILNEENAACDVIDPDENESMFALTNSAGMFGASSILYDGVLAEFAAKRGNFYILPSSVHEVLLVPEEGINIPPSDLVEMVRSINSTEVATEDKLSDHVYFYSSDSGQISIKR